MQKTKPLFFHILTFVIPLFITLSANANCPNCGSPFSPGASGGVCAKCGETESASDGVAGLCQTLIELLKGRVPFGNEPSRRIFDVAEQCLAGRPIVLAEQQVEVIRRINAEMRALQEHIDRGVSTQHTAAGSGSSSQGALENGSQSINPLLSQRDFEIIFALTEAGGVFINSSLLPTTFFCAVRFINLRRASFETETSLTDVVNDKRFFIFLYYRLLTQPNDQVMSPSLFALTERLKAYLEDLGKGRETRLYRAIFLPVLRNDYLGYDPFPPPMLPPNNPRQNQKEWILYCLKKPAVPSETHRSYAFRWPEPHSEVWMLLDMNPDHTVTVFFTSGIGMLTTSLEDLESILDRMETAFAQPESLVLDTLLVSASLGTAAYQVYRGTEISFSSVIPHMAIWLLLFCRWGERHSRSK